MSVIDQVHDLIMHRNKAAGRNPENIPLSREEIIAIKGSMVATACPSGVPDTLFNLPTFETPYAPEMRTNRITLAGRPFVTEFRQDELTNRISMEAERDRLHNQRI